MKKILEKYFDLLKAYRDTGNEHFRARALAILKEIAQTIKTADELLK